MSAFALSRNSIYLIGKPRFPLIERVCIEMNFLVFTFVKDDAGRIAGEKCLTKGTIYVKMSSKKTLSNFYF